MNILVDMMEANLSYLADKNKQQYQYHWLRIVSMVHKAMEVHKDFVELV